MKYKYKQALMDMAVRFGQTSEAVRLKVGCLIYKDGIIAEGVNGMPPGWPTEVCEDKIYAISYPEQKHGFESKREGYLYRDEDGAYKLITKPECRHAEIAALEKIWGKHETTQGAAMFISHSPCKNCSIKIHTAGIKEVYYRYEYRSSEGLKYLQSKGIKVEQIK